MLAEIITIGDELLIGQVVDTNSAWMGQQLNRIGVSVKQITSISDDREHILSALKEAASRADIILITGGLGPTKDDITKKTLCDYFGTRLVFNEEVYKDVEAIFRAYGKEVSPVNRLQAEVPENCTPIRNRQGTAPGMWFEQSGKVYVSMPGVPYEMKGIMRDFVLPELQRKFKLPHIVHRTILTLGAGESFLAQRIEHWEDSLSEHGIKLAYLPAPGKVRLRLSARGNDLQKLNSVIDKKVVELLVLAGEYIYGEEEMGEAKRTMGDVVGELLRAKKRTVATAESCTGGYIAHLITSVAGSSAWFKGAVVAYANEIKTLELDVPELLLKEHGAVSGPVVETMAKNLLKKFSVDHTIAVSGIAGPAGGSEEKPVGTVWIAVASAQKVISQKFLFGNDRSRNIEKAANAGLDLLRRMLMEG